MFMKKLFKDYPLQGKKILDYNDFCNTKIAELMKEKSTLTPSPIIPSGLRMELERSGPLIAFNIFKP